MKRRQRSRIVLPTLLALTLVCGHGLALSEARIPASSDSYTHDDVGDSFEPEGDRHRLRHHRELVVAATTLQEVVEVDEALQEELPSTPFILNQDGKDDKDQYDRILADAPTLLKGQSSTTPDYNQEDRLLLARQKKKKQQRAENGGSERTREGMGQQQQTAKKKKQQQQRQRNGGSGGNNSTGRTQRGGGDGKKKKQQQVATTTATARTHATFDGADGNNPSSSSSSRTSMNKLKFRAAERRKKTSSSSNVNVNANTRTVHHRGANLKKKASAATPRNGNRGRTDRRDGKPNLRKRRERNGGPRTRNRGGRKKKQRGDNMKNRYGGENDTSGSTSGGVGDDTATAGRNNHHDSGKPSSSGGLVHHWNSPPAWGASPGDQWNPTSAWYPGSSGGGKSGKGQYNQLVSPPAHGHPGLPPPGWCPCPTSPPPGMMGMMSGEAQKKNPTAPVKVDTTTANIIAHGGQRKKGRGGKQDINDMTPLNSWGSPSSWNNEQERQWFFQHPDAWASNNNWWGGTTNGKEAIKYDDWNNPNNNYNGYHGDINTNWANGGGGPQEHHNAWVGGRWHAGNTKSSKTSPPPPPLWCPCEEPGPEPTPPGPTPPTGDLPTYMPTYEPTYGVSSDGPTTYGPTEPPVPTPPGETPYPTFVPTDVDTPPPTPPAPTVTPPPVPGVEPTPPPSSGPDEEECAWFYWGANEGRGFPLGTDQRFPQFQDEPMATDLSSGSRHSFLIDGSGRAYASGFIESFGSYKGHLGIETTSGGLLGSLKEGANEPTVVTKVYRGGSLVSAPRFRKVYAAAGAPGDSRDMHSLLIDESGKVYTTGNNNMGQLCLGDQSNREVFTQVDGLPAPAVSAAIGLDFTLILLSNGQVYGCGSNENGELGLGPSVPFSAAPNGANGLSNIEEVRTGLSFAIYKDTLGTVFGTGSNLFGQMCEFTEGSPIDRPQELALGREVTQIQAGRESTYFLTNQGVVYSCGRNNEGQLGDGTTVDSPEPVTVQIPKSTRIHTLGSGPSSASAFFIGTDKMMDSGDMVYGVGQNYRYQLGIGETGAQSIPVIVPVDVNTGLGADITKISSSGSHALARVCLIVTETPTQFPTVTPTTPAPTELPTAAPTMYPTFTPSYNPTMGPKCHWWYWGGEEGRGEVVGPDQEVPDWQPEEVIDVSAGSRHSFYIHEDGTAYVSGFIESFFAYQGHLGINRRILNEGENGFRAIDTVLEENGGAMPAPKFVKVYAAAGAPGDSRDMHALLIDVDGNVYTSGNNDMGQLCLGDQEQRDEFTLVKLPAPAVAAGVGLDFTIILLDNGKVYGCGSNENGELGLGSNVQYVTTPDARNGLSDITDLSAGLNFGLYLNEDGTVFGSGSNLFSQLCESTGGDPVDKPMELAVKGVEQIMAGRESSYFLYPNGSVDSCGRNDEGQLGDGTFVDSDKPVKVDIPNGTPIRLIGSGPSSQSVFFVADEDIVYAAGQNYRHQLGIGDIGSEKFPVLVEFDDSAGRDEIIKISSSGTHTMAISCLIITDTPTSYPTVNPTETPTALPTELPTDLPTALPTVEPTMYPTDAPTYLPTAEPTTEPTDLPTEVPTELPTMYPTIIPTASPTITTDEPTDEPTMFPTLAPTIVTDEPTMIPTMSPTFVTEEPTMLPTLSPTIVTDEPTMIPTMSPTIVTDEPTMIPTMSPTIVTDMPTDLPTVSPTIVTEDPTSLPTITPTETPTIVTDMPTDLPTVSPTIVTEDPTSLPTITPTETPTIVTDMPTDLPTVSPTIITEDPTFNPTFTPTFSPTLVAVNWYYWGAEEGRGRQLQTNQQIPDEILGEIVDVSAGSRHTFLIQADGTAVSAGFVESDFSYKGHLGVGPVSNCKNDEKKLCEGENDPLLITEVVNADGKKEDAPRFERAYAGVGIPADSGEMHSVLISKDGRVYTTGNNNKGQLCIGTDDDSVDLFHEVKGIPKAQAAAVGEEFTLILTEDGDVYGCGSNEVGQIGQGENVDFEDKPTKIPGLKDISDVSTGLTFAIYLDRKNSKVYGTGGNLYQQHCGSTDGEPYREVREIKFDSKDAIIQVETNRESSYFLFDDGVARSCGRNDEGQLANGDDINSSSQKNPLVTVDLKEDIRRIGSGPSSQSVFFITEDAVYASGLNDRYQLGIDKIGSEFSPVKVEFEGPVDIEFVSSSGSHTVANGRYI